MVVAERRIGGTGAVIAVECGCVSHDAKKPRTMPGFLNSEGWADQYLATIGRPPTDQRLATTIAIRRMISPQRVTRDLRRLRRHNRYA